MTQAHYHLLFNHLPIIFPIVGLLVLIAGFIFRSEILKRTAFMIFAAGAITAFLASATGDKAEEAIEHLQGVSKHLIHEHEEISETFALLSYILGGISLLAVWASLKQKILSKILTVIVFVLCAVVLYFGQQTGTSGGEIRHPEIRNSVDNTPTQQAETD